MPEIVHLDSDCGVDDIIAAVEDDGAVIVDNFVSDDWLSRFNDSVKTSIDDYEPYDYGEEEANEFLGYRTVRLHGLISKAPCYAELVLDPRLLGVMDHFLKPNCGQYQLNSSEVIEIYGGETAQELHTDDMIWPANYWAPDKLLQFNVMIAGTEFTAANGATQVVPGSHKWNDPERQAKPEEICQAVMTAGSAVFVPGKTLHGGGTNTDGGVRRSIVVSYVLGWLRSQENHYLHTTVEQAAKWPPRLRELYGYDLVSHYDENLAVGPMGYYEQKSPSVLFD